MKRNFIVVAVILSGIALIVENHANAFETEVYLKEDTSWTGRTTLRFDQPVNGVEKLVYHPLARTLNKVFTFRNHSGKTLYLAHEQLLRRKSVVTLYQLNGDTPSQMATIQDTTKGKIEVLNSKNDRVGSGTNQLGNKHNPRISLSEDIIDFTDRTDPTPGEYTIDRTQPGVFKITVKDSNHSHDEAILLLASYVAFQKHKEVRRRDVVITAAAILAAATGKYLLSQKSGTSLNPTPNNNNDDDIQPGLDLDIRSSDQKGPSSSSSESLSDDEDDWSTGSSEVDYSIYSVFGNNSNTNGRKPIPISQFQCSRSGGMRKESPITPSSTTKSVRFSIDQASSSPFDRGSPIDGIQPIVPSHPDDNKEASLTPLSIQPPLKSPTNTSRKPNQNRNSINNIQNRNANNQLLGQILFAPNGETAQKRLEATNNPRNKTKNTAGKNRR